MVGRTAEYAQIHAAVSHAFHAPVRLLLLGEEGIGKTTLLTAAAHLAEQRGLTVVRTTGADRRLPELINAACTSPAALVVDDVHAAAPDTLTALAKGSPNGSGLLLMAATGPLAPIPLDRTTPELIVPPLSDTEAAKLIDSIPNAPVGWFRGQILWRSCGNPLGIVELSKVAIGASYELGLQHRFVLPDRLRRGFAGPVRRLPARTRRALLYAAASDDTEHLEVVLAAAGADLEDFCPAEEAGLITIIGNRLTFRHPLTPIACYLDASPQQRLRAHRALADHSTGDPGRRARHLACAQQAPDESIAALIEVAASGAAQQCRYFDAAGGMQQAAALSPHREQAASRTAMAARMAALHGDIDWSRQLWNRVVEISDDPNLQGMALTSGGFSDPLRPPADTAVDRVLRLRHTTLSDRSVTVAMAATIGANVMFSDHQGLRAALPHLLESAELLTTRNTPGIDPAPAVASTAMLTAARAVLDPGGWRRGISPELLEPQDGPVEDVRLLSLGVQAWLGDDPVSASTWLRRTILRLRDRNAADSRPFAYVLLIDALIDTGAWPEASALQATALEVAARGRHEALGQAVTAQKVFLLAARGEPGAAHAALAPLEAQTAGTGNRTVACLVHRAAAQMATTDDDLDRAMDHYLSMVDTPSRLVWPYRVVGDLAAAAAKVGRRDEVVAILDRMRKIEDPSPRQERAFGRAAALLGVEDDTDTERHLADAAGDTAADLPYEQAIAQIGYADWLRARRRHRDARPYLSAAYETFQRIGAGRHAEAARAQVRATGIAREESGSEGFANLTAQQQHIARLAAQGMTNREIAARLALSPRTVGSHLYQIYPKVGISRRHQLTQIIPG